MTIDELTPVPVESQSNQIEAYTNQPTTQTLPANRTTNMASTRYKQTQPHKHNALLRYATLRYAPLLSDETGTSCGLGRRKHNRIKSLSPMAILRPIKWYSNCEASVLTTLLGPTTEAKEGGEETVRERATQKNKGWLSSAVRPHSGRANISKLGVCRSWSRCPCH